MNPDSSHQPKIVPAVLPGEQWNNRSSRRRFLVGTGKAGALTILGLHSLKVEVVAGTGSAPPTI